MSSASPDLPDDCLVVRLPEGTPLVRVHWRDKSPVWFGPKSGDLPSNRFDAPNGEYGTLYGAESLAGAFAETVLRKAARIIAWPLVAKRSWSVLELRRDLQLAQLHGDGLAWHGVTGDICTGDDYGPSQALSLAFHEKGLDGIVYRSRHNNDQLCYAIFDRVLASDFALLRTSHFEDEARMADQLLRRHNSVWDPLSPLPPLDQLP